MATYTAQQKQQEARPFLPHKLTLDERSRTVLVLRYFEGLDSQQVAERMGLSPVNVRVIQSRALNALREQAEQMHLR